VRHRRLWIALAGLLVINLVFFLRDPLGIRGNVNAVGSSATAGLLYSVPDPWARGTFEPLVRFDAEKLNELRGGVGLRLLYVPADSASVGPAVVSVNPIDDFTWGAAALSKEGRCYLILILHKPADPKKLDARFAVGGGSGPCVGADAKPGSVQLSAWPD